MTAARRGDRPIDRPIALKAGRSVAQHLGQSIHTRNTRTGPFRTMASVGSSGRGNLHTCTWPGKAKPASHRWGGHAIGCMARLCSWSLVS